MVAGMVWSVASGVDSVEPIVLDNSRINAQLYAYMGSHGLFNDTERYGGGSWGPGGGYPEPGSPGSGPSPTGPGSPIATVVQLTIQTLNLLIPILTSICQALGTCAGLVGPEAYLGRFWAVFLQYGSNPIQAFNTAVQAAIAELRAYAQANGIGLVIGTGTGFGPTSGNGPSGSGYPYSY